MKNHPSSGIAVLSLIGLLMLPPVNPARAEGIPLKNAGFDMEGTGGIPQDWKMAGTMPAAGITCRVDRTAPHSGSASLRITHAGPASSTLTSAPVTLEVGKLYKLSGWIKTDSAISDPTSRYPTALPALLSMESFPFTTQSPSVGSSSDWTNVEVLFFATRKEDRVRVHLGYNGTATGSAWFDDLQVEEVSDITEFIPMERVRWFGPAFRYTDRGWTFVHIEGEPYARGFQYGYLLAADIVAYMEKLAVRANADNPQAGWQSMRTMADALMLRNYDEEYLVEMRGIADGAAKAGGKYAERTIDFLDIVTVNSAVDLGQVGDALTKTAHPLSGRSFRQDEEEAAMQERLHKCSSFLANGPATKDGRIVFGQLFMWNGYTGVHWDIICDVIPSKGRRLVFETFPGGIHSGADFYLNDAGIMIGETTVAQTPFDVTGEPQSSRIRKAAQYATSVDDVVKILTTKNNGLYTNDWLIGDVKANEIAILLLGTKKHKLWRSGKGEFPGSTSGFLWSINNAKDMEVRKEYIPNPANAPFDLAYTPWNRDLSFNEFYKQHKGSIDATAAVNVLATSPINRSHACDGKVTTSEMAEQMVFLAHFGKVTMREKFPMRDYRLMPDLPNAIPHLSLGYSVISPKFVVEKLKALRAAEQQAPKPPLRPANDFAEVKDLYSFEKRLLWMNTVYPSSDAENWFVSGTAAYWRMLDGLPGAPDAAMASLRDQLAELSCRMQYTMDREGSLAPLKAARRYDRYADYQIPRIRGTYLLHQLRLMLGNDRFSGLMNSLHDRFREKSMTTQHFLVEVEKVGGAELRPLVLQWLEREDFPRPQVKAKSVSSAASWSVQLTIEQEGEPYRFATTVAVETEKNTEWHTVTVNRTSETFTLSAKERPRRVIFNAGNDIPVMRKHFYIYSNYFDDFQNSFIVYGTARQVEANHTMALRYQQVLADAFTETLPPVVKDSEVNEEMIARSDLLVIGSAADNTLLGVLAGKLGLSIGKDHFLWKGKVYGSADDGLIAAYPNPYNPKKAVYLVVANSALQLYHMTKRHQPLPSWGLFSGEKIVERGYHVPEEMTIALQ